MHSFFGPKLATSVHVQDADLQHPPLTPKHATTIVSHVSSRATTSCCCNLRSGALLSASTLYMHSIGRDTCTCLNVPHVMLSSSNTSPVGLSMFSIMVTYSLLSRTSTAMFLLTLLTLLTLCNKKHIPAYMQERSCTAFYSM